MSIKTIGIFAATGLLVSATAHASLDTKKPAICANIEILECVPDEGCEKVSAQAANLPRFLRVDIEKKMVTRTRPDGTGQTSKIERSVEIDDRVILQGAEDGAEDVRDGIGWSLAIDKISGDMVLTGSGHDVGFVIFGACETL